MEASVRARIYKSKKSNKWIYGIYDTSRPDGLTLIHSGKRWTWEGALFASYVWLRYYNAIT